MDLPNTKDQCRFVAQMNEISVRFKDILQTT